MKYIYLVLLSILVLSCHKEETTFVLDYTKGRADINLNGDMVNFRVSHTKLDDKGLLNLTLHTLDNMGFPSKIIYIRNIPAASETYNLKQHEWRDTVPSIRYYINDYDVVLDDYKVRTELGEMRATVTIDEYEEGKRGSGTFTATFDKVIRSYVTPAPEEVRMIAEFEAFLDK